MDIIEAINTRKSIRAYKPDPVPRAIIEDILQIATRSPSSMNTQPWEFVVVAGEALERLTKANLERLAVGEIPARDWGRNVWSDSATGLQKGSAQSDAFTGAYRERQVSLAVQIFQKLGIAREDREKRAEWTRQGFRYFGAPAVIIITMDKSLSPASFFDIGLVTQTIALAALKHGLGTCIQGQGVMYPKAVREITGIPESKYLIICLTIGYPDWSSPANAINSEREPLEKITTWLGY